MEDQAHKPHRKSKEKKKHTGDKNPKAFAFSNPGKLQRQAARSSDIKEKRLHVPLVDRLPDEAPPRLVAIVGPPGVGKTTLLKSLIRRYAKEAISDPQGPVTVVTSKKQRLTFVECPNELAAMVDVAKVADIVLLMIDGNYGFEMETMEFLNILAATGMPGNVFGILTHLDLFRKPAALKDAKKHLKRRLWTELYQGAHLFYLSGIMNGRYPDREIHNLSRFLSVMKNPRPLVWRNSHPYTIIDSFRDITHPTKIEQDPRCDRSIVLSGYLRGTNFATQGQRVHVAGLGDFTVSAMEVLPDPCPTPAMEQALAKMTGKTGRRRLDEKEKKLYAPMSDRSGLKIDGDAIWITRDKGFTFDKDADNAERGEGEEMIIGLQAERRLLGQTEDGVLLFRGGQEVRALDEEEDTGRKEPRKARIAEREEGDDGENGDDEGFVTGSDEEDPDEEEEFSEGKLGRMFRSKGADKAADGDDDVAFADSDSDLGSITDPDDEGGEAEEDEDDDSDEEAAALRWKEGMADRAMKLHTRKRSYHTADLARYLYDGSMTASEVIRKWKGEEDDSSSSEGEEGVERDSEDEEFFHKTSQESEDLMEDRSIPEYDYQGLAAKWGKQENVEALKRKFTSGRSSRRSGGGGDDGDDDGDDDEDGDEDFGGFGDEDENDDRGEGDDDSEGDGEFEDLEAAAQNAATHQQTAGEMQAEREKNAKRKEELKARFEEEDRDGFMNDKAKARREGGGDEQEFGEDDWYDAQKAMIQKQLDINKEEFANLDERQRVAVEGHRAGKYAKLVLEGVPAEFVSRFDARLPIVVGGLSATEDRWGFVQVRIKRHRWHKKILKTNDPLIFSLGWRRFQTLPIYSISDSRTRNRMLKYTPEHMHCFGTVYAPLIAPNTGFVCFNSLSAAAPGFRIAATGTVLSVDESTEIVKKLKLTGAPYKIFKNTAFIKGMFNSALEIAKFEGASIKTVSGVRGQIKRALSKPEGHFRATFEDKILASDIVFLRAWYPIRPHRFYNPVCNLVGWRPMRLTGEVRRAEGVATPQLKNSQYRKVERQARHFNGLQVPRALAASLPFRSQIVAMKPQKKKTYMQKRAVVLGAEERKTRAFMQKVLTVHNDQVAKRRAKKEEARAVFKKKMAEGDEKREAREKKESKEYWRKNGRKRSAGDDEGGGGGKRRR